MKVSVMRRRRKRFLAMVATAARRRRPLGGRYDGMKAFRAYWHAAKACGRADRESAYALGAAAHLLRSF